MSFGCYNGKRPPYVCIHRSLIEEHVAELETLLDAELVDALDDTIGEKIEDNQREKTR